MTTFFDNISSNIMFFGTWDIQMVNNIKGQLISIDSSSLIQFQTNKNSFEKIYGINNNKVLQLTGQFHFVRFKFLISRDLAFNVE